MTEYQEVLMANKSVLSPGLFQIFGFCSSGVIIGAADKTKELRN